MISNMSGFWKNYTEITSIGNEKKILLWGRSEDWTAKTLSKISHLKVAYIIDSSDVFHETDFLGYRVYLPEILLNENLDDVFIIITASAYKSIQLSMSKFGLIAGKHYCCTPEYKDWALLQDIKEYDQDILICCSDNTLEEGGKRFSKLGGGLFVFNTKSNEITRKLDGHFRQIINIRNLYYVVEFIQKKLYVLNEKFEIHSIIELDQSSDKKFKPHYCGIAYHESSDQIFVSNSGNDTISVYSRKNLKSSKTFYITSKTEKSGGGLHHINDLAVVGDSLLISCFSVTGSWKYDIHDGGLFEFNINNLDEKPNILNNSLWKPHSVKFIENKICYLDSMRGYFYLGSQKIAGKFDGFIRGLAYDGRFYFIGQSEDMYTSELFGIKDNIMINAGFYLFDNKTNVSRFYSIPEMSNIHDLLPLKNNL